MCTSQDTTDKIERLQPKNVLCLRKVQNSFKELTVENYIVLDFARKQLRLKILFSCMISYDATTAYMSYACNYLHTIAIY